MHDGFIMIFEEVLNLLSYIYIQNKRLQYQTILFWPIFCMFTPNMLTYNLLETIYNIWLQQFKKRGSYLYIATFDGYVWSFKHNALYKKYLKGGTFRQGLNRNELHLCIMSASIKPLQMAIVVTNYVLSLIKFFNIIVKSNNMLHTWKMCMSMWTCLC